MPKESNANSQTVRIDRTTRDKIDVLRSRIIKERFTDLNLPLPHRGMTMAVIVAMAINALERELNGEKSARKDTL